MDLKNETIGLMLNQFQKECILNHSRKDCESIVHFTSAMAQSDSEFSILLVTTNLPWSEVKLRARTDFVEFLTMVVSTFSMWTGFAIVSLDPPSTYLAAKKNFLRFSRFFKDGSSKRLDLKGGSSGIDEKMLMIISHLDSLKASISLHLEDQRRETIESLRRLERRVRDLEESRPHHPFAPQDI